MNITRIGLLLLASSGVLLSNSRAQEQQPAIRVASISFEPVKFDLAGNTRTLEAWFRRAAAGGARIAVAPEGILEGYVVNQIIAGEVPSERMRDVAVAIDSPTIRQFQSLARELQMCLVFGFAERLEDDVYNCAIFIDHTGRICGKYHKMQLAEGYDDNWWFNRMGKHARAFDTPLGRCGILICNDRWNPQLASVLARDGAQFLVIPSFGSTSKKQDEAVLARGVENGLPVVEANVGVRLIVNDNRIAAVNRKREGITFAEIAIPKPGPVDAKARDEVEAQFLEWRREEMPRRLARRMESLANRTESENESAPSAKLPPGFRPNERLEQQDGAAAPNKPTKSAAERPNIVLLMADDMGYSDLGCYGGEIQTPNIDRLAASGLRFTHFYNNALCGPTRASLLTGLYCQQVGIRGHQWTGRRDYSRCATIGELLQLAGYRTMLVGKWQDRDVANRFGFHRYFGMKTVAPISYFNEIALDPYYLDEQPVDPPDGFFMTDLLTDYSLEFLDEAIAGEQPFFLYTAYVAPHWPLHARESDVEKCRQRYLSAGWDELRQQRYRRQLELGIVSKDVVPALIPDEIGDWKSDPHKRWQAERMAVYAAQVECLDRNIGRLVGKLEDAGVIDNTLILFLSDNGASRQGGLVPTDEAMVPFVHRPEWRVDQGAMRPGSSEQVMPGSADTFSAYGPAWAGLSNTPWRDYKWTAYEGGINTPLIAHWPTVIGKDNQITRQYGHVMDIVPTCLEAAGQKYPETMSDRTLRPLEGTSLMPILRGQKRREPESLFWYVRSRAVRSGDWKLVSPDERSAWELYNLKDDPTERQDLASDNPRHVKDLEDRYRKWTDRVGITKWALP